MTVVENSEFIFAIEEIADTIIETLIIEQNVEESIATRILFTSSTYSQLANEQTLLYKKNWQEIYELLKKEQAM